jgi:hypothetical protein
MNKVLAALFLIWAAGDALAQAMNPAPPIPETGPAGSNSAANTLSSMDFNWVWASLVVIGLGAALWYLVRRRAR